MQTVENALAAILAHVVPLRPGREPCRNPLGAILAEDVVADLDLPPFDKALVDGFAVRTADLSGAPPYRLKVGEEITAGRVPSRPLAEGEAAVVMTGAPLAAGADAVVMHERTRLRDDGTIEIDEEVVPGQNRLARGRELRAGEVVLRKGERLNAPKLGLLASVGQAQAATVPRPWVVIVPTGDELVEPGKTPGPGQIRETNATILEALAETCKARVLRAGIARDDPKALRRELAWALGPLTKPFDMEPDVVLVCGGVSAGKRDLVPAALESLGVRPVFHKVRLKPGKPLWFGVGPPRRDKPGALVFGLPGNPVSGIVCFLLFVRPALDVLRGLPPGPAATVPGVLLGPFAHRGDRPTYHPARRDSSGRIEPLDWAGSADLRTVARADGFALFPTGDRTYEAGERVEFLPWPSEDP